MRIFVSAALLAVALGTVTVHGQPAMRQGMGMHGAGQMHGMGGMQASMLRHRYLHQHGIDAQYADKANPLAPTAADLDAGRALYGQLCAQCHGPSGHGDGDAGKALNPAPADLTLAAKRPMATDAYLYWTVAEGGVPVGSAMPPFKSALSETQIWQLISYLRGL
jgi:mono/diheme cytochrome c family protein